MKLTRETLRCKDAFPYEALQHDAEQSCQRPAVTVRIPPNQDVQA